MELTTTTHMLLAALGLLLVALALHALYKRKQHNKLDAPGPYAWPFIGSLHLLGGYEVPYAAFSALAQRYGDVVKLSLGNQKCLVVNGLTNIKEALITKGAHFDGRPNFARFHQLFCGDKENCKCHSDHLPIVKQMYKILTISCFFCFSLGILRLVRFTEIAPRDVARSHFPTRFLRKIHSAG